MSNQNRSKKRREKKNVSKEKIFNLSIGILGIALCSVLTIGLTKENKISALNKEQYNQWLLEKDMGKEVAIFNEEELSVYEKLKNEEEVNILILGDKLGKSEGIEDESKTWHNKLERWIRDTYKSKVNLINLSSGNTSIYKGLINFAKCEEKNFDLVIICYGEEDQFSNNEDFPYAYEGLIREIKASKEKVEIIPVIESSLQEEYGEIENIKFLAEYYNLPLANVREGFLNSEISYKEMLNEQGTLPNEKGYDIYFNVIKDEIKRNIENNAIVNEDIRLLHGGTKKFID